jgi:pimeloyl-ACP methyl ester carboxylesterase
VAKDATRGGRIVTAPDIGLRLSKGERRAIVCEDATVLSYWVTGNAGPAIVCVSAHGQDLLVFSKLVEILAQRHRVIAWKPRGTLEPGTAATTVLDQVADLQRIIQRERVDECSIISWCAGAKVAVMFARQSPRVKSLVLTNGTFTRIPGLEHLETKFEQTLEELCRTVVRMPSLAKMMMGAMLNLLGRSTADSARGATSSVGTDDVALNALIAEPFSTPETTLRYASQVVDYLACDISLALAEISIPTLVVSGQNDKISSPAMGRAVAEMLRFGSHEQLPSGSHYCLYDQPERVAACIERFLTVEKSSPMPWSDTSESQEST